MKTMALSSLCLLLLVVGAVAGRLSRLAVENGELEDIRPCAFDVENLDISPLILSCNPSAMTVESCCRPFDSIVQQHLDEMLDNVVCTGEVFGSLDARGYKSLDILCEGGGRREAQQMNNGTGRATMPPAAPSSSNSPFAMVVPTCLQLALSMGAFFALL
eukprot:TRINITY_DN16820_c0_g3_i2.p1 TRINITY_DN16820_c0_g3~~TRINITY_DN16820_c0_g3_i2.p1  ORF type:complete len:160 (+),score=26.62 TRINITY_DN16820_c0_g3_i2:146-625(+)